MTLAQARALKSALDEAIAKAEADGTDAVDLQQSLSSALGGALDELNAAIDAAYK